MTELDEDGFHVFNVGFAEDDHLEFEAIWAWIAETFPHNRYYRDWTCSRYGESAVFRFKNSNDALLFKLTWG